MYILRLWLNLNCSVFTKIERGKITHLHHLKCIHTFLYLHWFHLSQAGNGFNIYFFILKKRNSSLPRKIGVLRDHASQSLAQDLRTAQTLHPALVCALRAAPAWALVLLVFAGLSLNRGPVLLVALPFPHDDRCFFAFLTIGRWTVIAFRWIYPDWGDKACIIVCLSWFHYSWTHVMLWTTSCVNSHAQVLHHTSISHCNNIPSMFQERQLWLFW